VKLNVFDKMLMEFYGSRTVLWFQRTSSFSARLWMRLIALGIISIQESTRCIKNKEMVPKDFKLLAPAFSSFLLLSIFSSYSQRHFPFCASWLKDLLAIP
jgi:hypothetical protein